MLFISIHAPIVGCDHKRCKCTIDVHNFNPRTHRGVRHMSTKIIEVYLIISIHAPIVGCDGGFASGIVNKFKFQSTHPSWGATTMLLDEGYAVLISIHAPIVGCDKQTNINPFTIANFNPRTHRGVRHCEGRHSYRHGVISIHAPIVGCDL